MFPEDLKYTSEHEWVQEAGEGADRVRIGITDYAQEALGDIVYVTLPAEGAQVRAGDPCGELESTKSVSDIYSPVTGTVAAHNGGLEETPELINSDPYGEGWMFEVSLSDPQELASLLDVDTYRSQTEQA